jgi:hypothetical protein
MKRNVYKAIYRVGLQVGRNTVATTSGLLMHERPSGQISLREKVAGQMTEDLNEALSILGQRAVWHHSLYCFASVGR